MAQNRQLAAIMFTDIEGYTAIMQRDEKKAIQLREQQRRILHREHENFNGRVIQYYGDGTLSIFQSAVQAVQCALHMQLAFRNDPVIPVRIGLHIGDIIFDNEQVFGDGVNVASRIESLGIPGAVLISDRVREEIFNHPDLDTVSVGVYQLKNVERSIEVFALDHPMLNVPAFNSLHGKTETKKPEVRNFNFNKHQANSRAKKSIAVLPFENLSNDPDQEYFGEGVAAEILNSLSSIQQLKVAGRASSFRFRTKTTGLREIGQQLGVVNILEGSIRKQSNRVRVTVQLINSENGFQIWSERYDRNMDDIFAIQDEIALSVTEKLKLTLLDHDRKKISKPATTNTEAYELYLKGRFYMNRRAGGILTGIKYFQIAMELDPGYALAYAGYADANLMGASYGFISPVQAGRNAKEAAEKAIAINPDLSEPYCSLGFYYTSCEWNWQEAEKNFLHSLELNPAYAQAHYWYGLNFLAWSMGDFVNAELHGRTAIELEPLSSICYGIFGPILHVQKKFEETIEICIKGMELDPYAFLCTMYYGMAHSSLLQYDKAIAILERLISNSNRHHFAVAGLSICCGLSGDQQRAHVLLAELKERSNTEYVAPTLIGLAAAFLGYIDDACAYLQKGFENRDPVLLSIKYENWVAPELRQHPFFKELLEKIGYPVAVPVQA